MYNFSTGISIIYIQDNGEKKPFFFSTRIIAPYLKAEKEKKTWTRNIEEWSYKKKRKKKNYEEKRNKMRRQD